MKNILFVIFCIFCISCNSQNSSLMTPTIDNKFEKFDSTYFNSSSKKNKYVLQEINKDGCYIEMIKLEESRDFRTHKNSFFSTVKLYHNNLNIKRKGLGFNANKFAFKKGIWYEFNEKGELIKEVDYDKAYDFSFEDILAFCAKEKIPVDKGPILQSTGYHTMIMRNEDVNTSGAVWEIRWLKKPDIEESIKLDGKTGKILERKETMFINN